MDGCLPLARDRNSDVFAVKSISPNCERPGIYAPNEFSGVPQLRLVRFHGLDQPQFVSGWDFGEGQARQSRRI